MYNINSLSVKLQYDIAESGYITKDDKIIQERVFEGLIYTANTEKVNFAYSAYKDLNWEEKLYFNDSQIGKGFIGWKKSELIAALKESEFFEEKIDSITEENGSKVYLYTYPKLGPRQFIIKKERTLPILDNLSKVKLEYLYRYINNTDNVNFLKLCSIKFIDKVTLIRMLDKFNPNFIRGEYHSMEVNQICNALTVLRNLPIDQDYINEFKYQPGGRYMKQIQEKYARDNPGLFKNSDNIPIEKLPAIYQKYIDNCGSDNITLQEILYDIIELGLSNQINRQMNKEQLCKIIRNYILNTLDIYKNYK